MTELTDFKKELKQLLSNYNVCIGVNIKGDTHGLNYEFVVADTFHGKTLDLLSNDCFISFSDILAVKS